MNAYRFRLLPATISLTALALLACSAPLLSGDKRTDSYTLRDVFGGGANVKKRTADSESTARTYRAGPGTTDSRVQIGESRKHRSGDRNRPRENRSISTGFHLRIGGLSIRYHDYDYDDHCDRRFCPPAHYEGFHNRLRLRTVSPCHYGYYVFQYTPGYCSPALYCHYGLFPYICRERVVYVERPVVRCVEVPIVVDYGDYDYYLSAPSGGFLGRALSDIRRAWTLGDIDLIERHVRTGEKVAVYLEGEYSYSVDGRDYLDMTRDAMERIETVSFDFIRTTERASDEAAAYAEHRYVNEEGKTKTVYLKYTLEKRGATWIITEVGSSPRPYD